MCSRERNYLRYVYKRYLLAAVSPCRHSLEVRPCGCLVNTLLLGGGIADIWCLTAGRTGNISIFP